MGPGGSYDDLLADPAPVLSALYGQLDLMALLDPVRSSWGSAEGRHIRISSFDGSWYDYFTVGRVTCQQRFTQSWGSVFDLSGTLTVTEHVRSSVRSFSGWSDPVCVKAGTLRGVPPRGLDTKSRRVIEGRWTALGGAPAPVPVPAPAAAGSALLGLLMLGTLRARRRAA